MTTASSDPVPLCLGAEIGDHIRIDVLGWAIDEPENELDSACLLVSVEVSSGPLHGRFETQLRRGDIVDWRDELTTLDHEFRPGHARFRATLEPTLGFAVTVGATGSLSVDGFVAPWAASTAEQRLEFSFPTEQSVQGLLTQIETLLERFPPRAP